MHFVRSILSTVALFGAAAYGLEAKYKTEESVLVLGDDDLAAAIKEIPFLLVEFYAPWCGHCKQLAPEYATAAQALEDNEETFLAKVDATEETKVASEFGVSGYPTLKFFKNGEASEYNGGRTAPEIIAWLEKKSGPAVNYATAASDVEALKEANAVVVVLFSTDKSEDNKAVKHFTKLADATDDVVFVIVSEQDVAKELEIEGDGSVVLFKQYDEGRVNFEGDKVTKKNLDAFVKPHLLPYVVEFSDDVVARLFGGDIKEHMLYFRKEVDSPTDKAVMEDYRTVAKAHQGELIFVAVNVDVAENSRLTEFFGLTETDYPAVRIINIIDGPKKFKPPAGMELTEAGFESFASKYIAGEVSAALNSEDTPSDWDAEEVKVIVGANFKEVCLDQSKNVMLMAHAPWCGHCKSLMPVFEELAEHFEDDESVVIAKMDATKNEVEAFSVEGFPTLKFFPSGSSDVQDYDGGREFDELVEFINTNRGDAADEGEDDEEDEKDEL